MAVMLDVKNINVYYGAIHAVKDISFQVNEGEIVTLIGANGAGKTTTLQTVSGLLHTRTGSIELTIDAEGLSPGDVAYCTIPELGYKATVRVADVITQSQSDSTTRTVRLGTPVWRKL